MELCGSQCIDGQHQDLIPTDILPPYSLSCSQDLRGKGPLGKFSKVRCIWWRCQRQLVWILRSDSAWKALLSSLNLFNLSIFSLFLSWVFLERVTSKWIFRSSIANDSCWFCSQDVEEAAHLKCRKVVLDNPGFPSKWILTEFILRYFCRPTVILLSKHDAYYQVNQDQHLHSKGLQLLSFFQMRNLNYKGKLSLNIHKATCLPFKWAAYLLKQTHLIRYITDVRDYCLTCWPAWASSCIMLTCYLKSCHFLYSGTHTSSCWLFRI